LVRVKTEIPVQWAAKAGGHELKGLMGVKSARVSGLHLPLIALIDYRGYRLVAMSVLPITKNSLVYGSNDGGDNGTEVNCA